MFLKRNSPPQPPDISRPFHGYPAVTMKPRRCGWCYFSYVIVVIDSSLFCSIPLFSYARHPQVGNFASILLPNILTRLWTRLLSWTMFQTFTIMSLSLINHNSLHFTFCPSAPQFSCYRNNLVLSLSLLIVATQWPRAHGSKQKTIKKQKICCRVLTKTCYISLQDDAAGDEMLTV